LKSGLKKGAESDADSHERQYKDRQLEDAIFPVKNLRENLYAESAARWEKSGKGISDNKYGGRDDGLMIEANGEYIFEVITKKSAQPAKSKKFTMGGETSFGYDYGFENGIGNLGSINEYLKLMENLIKKFKAKNPREFMQKSVYIEKWVRVLVQIGSYLENFEKELGWEKTTINHFRTFFQSSKTDQRNCKINLACLDPGICFNEILAEGPHNIILTSGTLTPFETYQAEFKIPFPVTFSCEHIIENSTQIYPAIVSSMTENPGAPKLNFSYQNRNNADLINGLGRGLIYLCRTVPKGLLVFFTSYAMMNQYLIHWGKTKANYDGTSIGNSTIKQSIEDLKAICIESDNKTQFRAAVKKYGDNYGSVKGAVFFGVCGGKLSEGIDFADDMARAIVLIGIPYPNISDPRCQAKRAYLDRYVQNSNSRSATKYNGGQWYQIKATRAINQAIGRVIRHRYDFGAIFLFDERYNWGNTFGSLSTWVKPGIKKISDFYNIMPDLKTFYQDASKYVTSAGGPRPTTNGADGNIFSKMIEDTPGPDFKDEI
jgi:DNA repair helicase Rad3